MKRHSSQAFTLIEMLTVMLIISILTGLIVAVATLANKKSAATKTQGEIEALSTAIGSYKADNGTVPRSNDTEPAQLDTAPPIDPRTNGNPTAAIYLAASVFLYQQLSGDADLDGNPGDAQPGGGSNAKVYFEFKPGMLGGLGNAGAGNGATVKYLQDPYGLSYGYSTAGASVEDSYRNSAAAAKTSTNAAGDIVTQAPDRTKQTQYGYNSTFDLWSTAGQTTDPPTDLVRQKWIKNW